MGTRGRRGGLPRGRSLDRVLLVCLNEVQSSKYI